MDLFVIPCHHDGRPLIDNAVASIRTHHPDADILVVDSASPDRTYMDRIDADIADIGNTGYLQGAYRYAARNTAADWYYLWADSLIVHAPLPRRWWVVRWFDGAKVAWGWDQDGTDLAVWGGRQLDTLGLLRPLTYTGVMGPFLSCPRSTIDQLDRFGYFDIDTRTKWEACGMERVTGIVLGHLGYDCRESLQGEHWDHFGEYPDAYVTKLTVGRM